MLQYKTLTSKAIELESNAQQSEDCEESAKQNLLHSQQVDILEYSFYKLFISKYSKLPLVNYTLR